MIYEKYQEQHSKIPYKHTTEGRKEYQVNIKNLNDNFKIALEREYCGDRFTQKQKDKLWEKSWYYGHSSGLSEVELYYMELLSQKWRYLALK